MAERNLLTTGVFLVILVVAIVLNVAGLVDWTLVPPLVLALSGIWIIVLSVIMKSSPQKYERSPFSTLAWGLLLIALGGAWFFIYVNWLYSLAVILVALGALAIIAALKRK